MRSFLPTWLGLVLAFENNSTIPPENGDPPTPPPNRIGLVVFERNLHGTMKISAFAAVLLGLISVSLTGCLSQSETHAASESAAHGEHAGGEHAGGEHHEHAILATSPIRKDVISTQPYVCQIHSCQHIEVRAL